MDLWGTLPHLLPQRLAKPARKGDAGELGKATSVEGHDLPLLGSCRRSDDEVVGATRGSCSPNVRQQDSVGLGCIKVIGLNRDGVENRCDEALPLVPPAPFRQLNTNPQLCHGDRRYGDIVTVVDRFAQRVTPALGVDQDRRVQDQSRQGSVTGSMPSRSSRSSPAQASSGRLARSASLSAFPVPPLAGPIVATARPWRTTTYDSPSRSTSSRTSENRRDASVALSCFMKSDYQISIGSDALEDHRVLRRRAELFGNSP